MINSSTISNYLLLFILLLCSACGQQAQQTGEVSAANEPFSLDKATFTTMDGKEVSLSSLKGKSVLINFWATWCGPCIEEMPSLAKAEEKWADDYTFVIASDETLEKLKRFNDKKNLAVTIFKANFSTDELSIMGYPTTLFLDAEGKEVERLVGARDWLSDETTAIFEKYK